MTAKKPAITVEEASMQEWAMLAFHAERAPRRARVTVKAARAAADDSAVGGARTGLWVALAAAMAGMAWWVT
jgi:hypothetical protein